MKISSDKSLSFGWNIKTHRQMTLLALQENNNVSEIEKNMISQFSKMPDLMTEELEDMSSAHFYDVLYEDPSFGTKNDEKNNALSKFLSHNEQAMDNFRKCKEELNKGNAKLAYKYKELGLRAAGYAVHYLQDASTPPHTEHGNYFHKLFRLPMHIDFERGKKYGASSRLDFLTKHYVKEELPFSTLAMLFHNTALFSVQPENHVTYLNKKMWPKKQQRCFNRGVNVSKSYLDYVLKFLPKVIK